MRVSGSYVLPAVAASAIASRAHIRLSRYFGAFVRIGIFACDHDDFSHVCGCHAFAGFQIAPGQEGFRAHVVIDEYAPEAGFGAVGERAVE